MNDVSGLAEAPPVAMGVNVVLGTGTSSPRFSVTFCPSVPRSCGLATVLVCESLSRKRTMAAGTAM